MGLFDWFGSRDLASVLLETHKVKVHGVRFELRKLAPLDFIQGTKAIQQTFELYKTKGEQANESELSVESAKKLKDHYADVFLASVISPKLARNPEQEGIWVQNLFSDWDLCNELYGEILKITYGKKKLKLLTSLKTG